MTAPRCSSCEAVGDGFEGEAFKRIEVCELMLARAVSDMLVRCDGNADVSMAIGRHAYSV